MIKLKGGKPESTTVSGYHPNHDSQSNGSQINGTDNQTNNTTCDLSLLRKPIATSVTSFKEARRAYEHGTEEIKNLLSNECDIIYECKVCRNIFRSLANFVSHKRCYCKTEFNTTQHFHFRTNGFIDHDVSTIIQAEQEFSQAYNYKLKKPDDVNKDLSSIVERLRRKQNIDDDELDDDQKLKLTEYYEQIHYKVTQEQNLKKKNHVVQLDRVPDSNVAVYQTVNKGERRNIKVEVNELHSMLTNKQMTLGPEGVINFNEDSSQSSSLIDDELICKTCNLKFQTLQTLKVHIEKKHLPSTQVYPCPSCNETFLQPAAVIRHLSNDHKKSMRRIRLMRDAIYKKSSRADEVVVKGPSRELSRLRQCTLTSATGSTNGDDNADDEDNQKKAYIENMENYKDSPMCTYCGKTFDRKAVLATHIQSCRKKNRKSRLAAAKAASPIMVDLDKIKIEQRSDTPDSMKTNSTDSVALNGSAYHLAEIKQSNLHCSLSAGLVPDMRMDTSESCSVKSGVLEAESRGTRNKRKRKSAVKIVNKEEHIQEGDELYWVVEEKDGVSLKKLKTEEQELIFSDLNDTSTARPTSTTTVDDDDEELPFVSASEVEKEAAEAAAAAVNGNTSPSTFLINSSDIKQEYQEQEQPTQPQPTSSRKRPKRPSNQKIKKPIKETDLAKTIPCNVPQCPKLFATKRNLKLHVAMFHYRQNLFKCKFCDYHGYRKIDTRNHIMLKHKFDCPPEELDTMIVRQEGKRPLNEFDANPVLQVKQEPLTNESDAVVSPSLPSPPTAAIEMTEESFDAFASQMLMADIDGEPVIVSEAVLENVKPIVNNINGNQQSEPVSNADEFFDVEEEIARVAAISQQQRDLEEQKLAEEKRVLEETKNSTTSLRQPSIDTALTKKRGRPRGGYVKSPAPETATSKSSLGLMPLLMDTDAKRKRRKKKPVVVKSGDEDHDSESESTSSVSPRLKEGKSKPHKAAMKNENVSDEAAITKRPIRNRIKTVKEDFVYDLSHFLKKEDDLHKEFPHLFPSLSAPPSIPTRQRQRASRNTSPVPTTPDDSPTVMMTRRSRELAREAAMPPRKIFQTLDLPVNNVRKYEFMSAVGGALKMAQIEASDHLACFSRPPEIPKERPQIPAKIAHLRRSDVDLKGWQAMMRQYQSPSPEKSMKSPKESSRSPVKRSQRRASISTEFREIRRRRKTRNRAKSPSPPSLRLHTTAPSTYTATNTDDDDDERLIAPKPVFSGFLDKLHEKTSKKVASPITKKKEQQPVLVKCTTHKQFVEYLKKNQAEDALKTVSMPIATVEPTPIASTSGGGGSKRITLLQRLAENKSRKSLEGLGS